MKCVDLGTLQALIDGELDISIKKDVEKHIADCEKCNQAYQDLKKCDDFAFGKLTDYRQFCEENFVSAGNHDFTTADNNVYKNGNTNKDELLKRKGVSGFMFKNKKIAAGVCLAAAVTMCATIQPVRAFISDALSIFRVENVKGFRVSLADMEEIRTKLEQKEKEINIESIGIIKREGFEEIKPTLSEAKAEAGFPVLLPVDADDRDIDMRAARPGQITFTIKVDNVNEALKSLGATKLLPGSLDGKTFTADFAYRLNYSYNKDGKLYNVSETKSPELAVPADVNVDELYDCLADLPILPKDVRGQLKSIKDWKNTVYLPVAGDLQEVDINGAKGFIAQKQNGGWVLVWYNEGTIYSMDGSGGREDLLQLAENMR